MKQIATALTLATALVLAPVVTPLVQAKAKDASSVDIPSAALAYVRVDAIVPQDRLEVHHVFGFGGDHHLKAAACGYVPHGLRYGVQVAHAVVDHGDSFGFCHQD